jgi:sulfur carrier protein ThiS
MKIEINADDGNVAPGTSLSEVYTTYREKFLQDSMVKVIKEKTGKTGLTVILNGRVVPPPEFHEIVLQENDDLRIHHPFFGG